jgi:hypothetical protein
MVKKMKTIISNICIKIQPLLFLLLIASVGHSQVYKFKSYENASSVPNSIPTYFDTAAWHSSDILIVLDDKSRTMTLYTKKDYKIDLISSDVERKKEGTFWAWDGVDDNGVKLKAELYKFHNPPLLHEGDLILKYQDYQIIYHLRKVPE